RPDLWRSSTPRSWLRGDPGCGPSPARHSPQAGTPKQASALLAARIHPTKQASWGPRMSNTLTPVFPTPRNLRVSRGPRVGGSLDLDHLITKSLGRVPAAPLAGSGRVVPHPRAHANDPDEPLL